MQRLQRSLPAEGRCTANLWADGVYLHSLSCKGSNGIEKIALEVKGDWSPVDRTKALSANS